MLVADEAHWGIRARSAHDIYVNSTEFAELPNAIVLLVSATPANLLTSKSRIPAEMLADPQAHLKPAICPSYVEGCKLPSSRIQSFHQEDPAFLKVRQASCDPCFDDVCLQ